MPIGKRISDLTTGTTPTSSDYVEIEQSGNSRKVVATSFVVTAGNNTITGINTFVAQSNGQCMILKATDTSGDAYIRFHDSAGNNKGFIGFTASADDTMSIVSLEDHRMKFRTGNGDGSTFYNRVHMYGNLDTDSYLAVVSPRSDNIGGCYIRFMEVDDSTTKGFIGYASTGDNDIDIINSESNSHIEIATTGTGALKVTPGGSVVALQVDANTTAGNTRFLVYDVDNATLERVSVGVADSGGAGFKVLRIPN